MTTEVRKLDHQGDYWNTIREAAACLSNGGLVVFPTETVYGIGANALSREGLQRLREVKGRAETKPFTVHVGSRSKVEQFVPVLSGPARRLVQKAWPGPLTLIFHVDDPAAAPVIKASAPEHIPAMYHQGTIGIRCPDDRAAADLLTETRVPIVAASANPGGAQAPVTADEALAMLDGQIDLVLDAGRTRYAKPSTIVELDGDGYNIIRAGVLDERTIQRFARMHFLLVCTGNTCRSAMAEGLLRGLLAEKLGCEEDQLAERGFHVESAGVAAGEGAPASTQAVTVMRRRGIDISRHRSTLLTPEAMFRADVVFAMTRDHLDAMMAIASGATDRFRLVGEQDIEDPVGKSEAEYAQCADRIEQALRRHVEEILF